MHEMLYTASQPGQVEELNVFKNRRQSIRRSARSGSVKGPIDPKGLYFNSVFGCWF